MLATGLAAPALADANLEYAVKASYLSKFAPFVQWPPQAFANAEQPFTICIVGENPFGTLLDEAVRDERVNGHKFIVRHLSVIRPGIACHILFAGKSAEETTEEMLHAVAHQPVLTVTDRSRGVSGGIVQFVLVGGRVRFIIDAGAAQDCGIVISSKLLELAVSVER